MTRMVRGFSKLSELMKSSAALVLLVAFATIGCLRPSMKFASREVFAENQIPQKTSDQTIEKWLEGLDLGAAVQTSGNSVTFSSYEANHATPGTIFIDNIRLIRFPELDLYVLQQKANPTNLDLRDFELFALVVEREPVISRSHFFRFSERKKPKREDSECWACHPAGPRVLRPERNDLAKHLGVGEFDDIAFSKIRDINRIILETRRTDIGDAVGMVGQSPLKHPKCYNCHRDSDGVRPALTKFHKKSILALIDGAADVSGFVTGVGPESTAKDHPALMPPGGSLSPTEKACFRSWLESHSSTALEGC